jgi:hypothetical protein
MIIAIMCQPPFPPVTSRESQRVCSHTLNDKGVHHLSRDRQVTLCGKDCGNFRFIVSVKSEKFFPDEGICATCVEKLGG